MYFCVSYILDIEYGIAILSEFSFIPYYYHYICLENLARYLRITIEWGIRYKIRGTQLDII